MHAFHEGLSGYDERNVLHDGCEECEERSQHGLDGLLALDAANQSTLWRYMRAQEWADGEGLAHQPSGCDSRMMRLLYLVAVFLERAGIRPDEVQQRMDDEHERLRAALGF